MDINEAFTHIHRVSEYCCVFKVIVMKQSTEAYVSTVRCQVSPVIWRN